MSATSVPSSADPSAARTSGPPASSLTDAALLTASAGGDGAAFERFVVAHQHDVLRFVRSLGIDGAAAEDVVQETFIGAWRGAATFRGEAPARAWLFGIARNAVRHAVRRHVDEPYDFEPLDAIAEAAGWGAADADRDATIDRRALVHDALAALSHADREVLVLRELEELSSEETAAALGLSVPAMKSRLQRARLRLTAALRARLSGETTP